MQILFRTLNPLFLVGILSMLILIFLHLQEPIRVDEPVAVQGTGTRASERSFRGGPEPILVAIDHDEPLEVKIDNEPLEANIGNEPLQVELTR
jgi:hypothetical protein